MTFAARVCLVFATVVAGLSVHATAADQCIARATPGAMGCADKCIPCPRHGCCRQKCGCGEEPPSKGGPPPLNPEDKGAPPPGGPPQTFVAPPATGVVQGPSRGWELGGISLTFPELTLKMPRLRVHGVSRFHQPSRMHLDGGVAPLATSGMATGVGAPMMAMPWPGVTTKGGPTPDEDKGAPSPPEPPKDDSNKGGKPPGAKRPCTDGAFGVRPAPTGASPADRLDELEVALRQQLSEIESVMQNIQRLRQQQAVSPVGSEFDAIPAPQFDTDSARRLRPLPPTPEQELQRAHYETVVGSSRVIGPSTSLQRLPPVRR